MAFLKDFDAHEARYLVHGLLSGCSLDELFPEIVAQQREQPTTDDLLSAFRAAASTVAPNAALKKTLDERAITHIMRGNNLGRPLDVLVREVIAQGYAEPEMDDIASALQMAASSSIPRDLETRAARFVEDPGRSAPLTLLMLELLDQELDGLNHEGLVPAYDKGKGKACPTSVSRELDLYAAHHLLTGYRNSDFIDLLVEALVEQGYQRPSYREIARAFFEADLKLSVDQVFCDESKVAVIDAVENGVPGYLMFHPSMLILTGVNRRGKEVYIKNPARITRIFNAKYGRPYHKEVHRRLLDNDGVEQIVEDFRNGMAAEFIMNDLGNVGYVEPSWEVFDGILAANGLSRGDVRRDVFGNFTAYDDRMWDDIVIPEGVLEETRPFDRHAATYIVEQFRESRDSEAIMNDLIRWNYVPPSWEVFSKVLEANGMVLKDLSTPGPNGKGFAGYDGRLSGRIVIPEGIFKDEA